MTYGHPVLGALELTEIDVQMKNILLDVVESFAKNGYETNFFKSVLQNTIDIYLCDSIFLIIHFGCLRVPKIEGVEFKPDPGHPRDWTYLQMNGPDDIKLQQDSRYSEAISFWASLSILENENLVKLRDEL